MTSQTTYNCPVCGEFVIAAIDREDLCGLIEQQIRAHMRERHPFRLWLFDRTRWSTVIQGLSQ